MPSYHICQQCGEAFTCRHLHRSPRFCSKACRRAYQAERRVTRQCRNCGESFTRPPSLAGPFCSCECAKEGLKRERLARLVSKGCPICGRTFSVSPSVADKTTCCSWECRCQHFQRLAQGRAIPYGMAAPLIKFVSSVANPILAASLKPMCPSIAQKSVSISTRLNAWLALIIQAGKAASPLSLIPVTLAKTSKNRSANAMATLVSFAAFQHQSYQNACLFTISTTLRNTLILPTLSPSAATVTARLTTNASTGKPILRDLWQSG